MIDALRTKFIRTNHLVKYRQKIFVWIGEWNCQSFTGTLNFLVGKENFWIKGKCNISILLSEV